MGGEYRAHVNVATRFTIKMPYRVNLFINRIEIGLSKYLTLQISRVKGLTLTDSTLPVSVVKTSAILR